MRRLGLVLVAIAVAGSLAACGSGKKSTTSNGPSAQTQIKSAYVKFFSSKTSVTDKVGLLENGPKFKSVIEAFASNPLAQNVSATVSSVTLQGANNAKVVYQVKVAGSALGKQTGSAVRENGTWKVGDASLCKLIAQGGTTPAVCKTS